MCLRNIIMNQHPAQVSRTIHLSHTNEWVGEQGPKLDQV